MKSTFHLSSETERGVFVEGAPGAVSSSHRRSAGPRPLYWQVSEVPGAAEGRRGQAHGQAFCVTLSGGGHGTEPVGEHTRHLRQVASVWSLLCPSGHQPNADWE